MSVYSDLPDEDLAADIAALSARIRGGATSAPVKSVAGEGRRVEYENMSPRQLKALYREACEERDRRAGKCTGAIGVRFP